MADRTDRTIGSGWASLLFLLLGIALAAVVQVRYTEPAEARLAERREERQRLEERCRRSGAERRDLQLRSRALAIDEQTQERYLRRIGYGRSGEFRLEAAESR